MLDDFATKLDNTNKIINQNNENKDKNSKEMKDKEDIIIETINPNVNVIILTS